jgi:hypothetical protein
MTIREIEIKEIQGWDKWAEKYKPLKNHFQVGIDYAFETYGKEVEYIQSLDPKYVWTWVEGDMCDLIVAGYSYVNRFSYYVTEIPWTDEEEYVLLSVQVECEFANTETGECKDDCKECEGYGFVTRYVG